ncbi:MAG TPA: triose-phosphate isomerase [Planctomycetota bacterium]|nr:triose-phosphate isomerase [Planctomycetota bacterium]
MRRLLMAGNWKMHLDLRGAIQLAAGLKRELADVADRDVVLFPPYPFLADVCDAAETSTLEVGAQNLHPEPQGAFTGEVSAAMLASVGCRWVIVGHSERRDLFAENDAFLNHKLRAALAAGLRPILCVGEHLAERDAGSAQAVVSAQMRACLDGFGAEDMERITLAYEPVWAIGTGRTATPQQANEMHAMIRALLAELFGAPVANATRILYGGSVKPGNAKALVAEADIDGALVGGASLKVEDFVQIVRA